MLSIVLAITPSLLRAANLILITQKDKEKSSSFLEIIKLIFMGSSWLSPMITIIPIMIFFQLFGDITIGILLIFFWFGPIIVSFYIKIENSNKIYFIWMGLYLGSLLTIILYLLIKYGFTQSILSFLTSSEFYCDIFAEIGLASVVISDIFYSNF